MPVSELEYAHAAGLYSDPFYIGQRQSQGFTDDGHSNEVVADYHRRSLIMLANYALNSRPHPVCQIIYTLPARHFLRALPLPPAKQKLAETGAKLDYGPAFQLASVNLPQVRLDLHLKLMVAGNSPRRIQSTLQRAGINSADLHPLERQPQALRLFPPHFAQLNVTATPLNSPFLIPDSFTMPNQDKPNRSPP